jgi:hypothetical protein
MVISRERLVSSLGPVAPRVEEALLEAEEEKIEGGGGMIKRVSRM